MKLHYALNRSMQNHTAFVYYLTVFFPWWYIYDLAAPDGLYYTQKLYVVT